MKKLLLTMLGVVGMLCSTSCSDEEIVSSVEGEAMVQFTVELTDGSDASRAISDGLSVDDLYCEVYSAVGGKYTYLPDLDKDAVEMTEGTNAKGETVMTAKVELALVKGQSYRVVFWAQNEKGAYTIAENENGKLTNITLNETTANEEANDAFTAIKDLTVTGPISETITLTRPFAQINFGTTPEDFAKAINAGINFDGKRSRIVVSSAASTYNALEGVAGEGAEREFKFKVLPTYNGENAEVLKVGNDDYKYLATAYVLVPEGVKLADLTMEIETGLNETITLNVPTAPVQRNYRTNILGNLLTNQAEFNVVVDPIYNKPDNNIDIWDGSTTTTPEADVNGVYRITTAAELVAMMNDSNYPNCNKYQNIVLENDIDLGGYTVKGFGDGSGFFDGIFDGQGHTISNFKIDATDRTYYAGLFNQVAQYSGENTVIKNLTVKNAIIAGTSQVGAVVGGANGNTVVENCKVVGCTLKAVKKIGSVIGYTAGGTVKNCHAEDCVIEYSEKEAGEILGYENTGSTVENNTFKNIAFKVSAVALANEMKPDANGVINITRDYTVVGDWASLALDGEITINGDGHTISNLNKPLFVGNKPNKLIVNGLTIADSKIGVGYENGLGTGAFISYIDAYGYAKFNDCHLIGSTVTGNERAGGLIAYCSGSNLNVNNCSVVGCEIKAVGGAGGFAAYTQSETVIENSKVEGSTFEATEDRTGKQALAGSVIGTVNGPTTINNVTSTGNTVKNYGATGVSEMFGRILNTINGSTYVTTTEGLQEAINAGKTNILLGNGEFELGGISIVADELTIVGSGKETSIVKVSSQLRADGKIVNLENLKYTTPSGLAYDEHHFGWVHYLKSFNMKNCNVDRVRLNVHNANIEGCEFTLNTSSGFDGYCIYYYGATESTVKVSGSTFNTAGKAVCLYNEGSPVLNFEVENCNFISNNALTDKAAIQMHTEWGISGTVKISNCTATGFLNVNDGLWNEINNNNQQPTDKFDIFVDDAQVH